MIYVSVPDLPVVRVFLLFVRVSVYILLHSAFHPRWDSV